VIAGRRNFYIAWCLALGAWVAGVGLRAALYFRLTPYGQPFVAHWDRYFFHALFYNLFGVFILLAPFAIYWLWRRDHEFTPERSRTVHLGLTSLFTLALFCDHFDAETMRSMGVHATPSFIMTYWKVGGSMDMVVRSMNHDAGGAWSPFTVAAVVLGGFLFWGLRHLRRSLQEPEGRSWGVKSSIAAAVLPVIAVMIAVYTPGGKFRYRKVRPYIMVMSAELTADTSVGKRPENFDALVDLYQQAWLVESADGGWRFDDPERPYVRTPDELKTPAQEDKWNVILLQVETLRALEVGAIDRRLDPSPTPTLDALATGPNGALWDRFLTFGPPTVTGTLSGHCGVRPHSRHNVTTRYTYVGFLCLPEVLRSIGYHAEYFTGSDPDWDGQSYWLAQWYDAHHFYRDANETDAVVLERATDRIIELGRADKPFMATIATISNHYPFNSRDPQTDIAGHEAITDRIKNTTRYSDAVIARMIKRLEAEPFFAKTLLVVYGDHGYNLGEHTPAGQRNGYHESTWSPLIIYGAHPRLPKGRHPELGGLMDVAPTVADILGIRIRNPWSGHSLIRPHDRRTLAHTKNGITFAESPEHSVVFDRATGQPHVFAASDMHQAKALLRQEEAAEALRARADARAALNDYLIEIGGVWTAIGD
jgi:hypothetical protein